MDASDTFQLIILIILLILSAFFSSNETALMAVNKIRLRSLADEGNKRAWYFATALAKQYEQILPFLEERRMDLWTHNKTIQKAIESYRITSEQKEYLRTLKIKREDRTVLLR